ncbi:MAG: transcriptional regulator [Novosphingobium sp. 28-62-57]|uniref:MerR family transcriptional regulator n=1 Tax=unclassified Novosphingobium TaxID=2644732 RepID=UPI000BCFD89B|nr:MULTISPECIES: MerR family transcriptional regulator [unclassified Novosphingobium]OYW50035.1 MAG: transcriptional regulator [Novosphingobium sp. 12-62-10]OYZ12189.1 MAG: transcriptional regulator [Novosphingobium sp. 28-62-57]OZA36074.1 MAG: transcriptional regulator [Novosphingobium sp. 17-62-9]HQS70168.1 MerR family transcriptional regulator [Novosphingobium sp.]
MSEPGPSDTAIIATEGKDPGALRTIGEVAKALGIRQHVLRYWEEQFPSLRPLTRAGGRRYYRPEDVALITEIDRLLHREGYTVKGAKQALRGGKPKQTEAAAPAQPAVKHAPVDSAAPLIEFLQGIRDRLATALEA